jgi:hypothetical protein
VSNAYDNAGESRMPIEGILLALFIAAQLLALLALPRETGEKKCGPGLRPGSFFSIRPQARRDL